MYYSSGCNCGCNYDCGCNTVPSTCCTTSSTTTTTTIPCDGEKCDEVYSTNCIEYTGPDLTCYGIQNGYSLQDILDVIIAHLPGCAPIDICFTVTSEALGTTSCLISPSLALWNGKVYYIVTSGIDCSLVIGYVYWSGTQWEFANGIGGGTELYSYLPIPSEYPITSPAGPWISVSETVIMESSTGGPCPVTTTTTAAPCPCDCITFVNPTSTAYAITWLDCAGQQIVIYNLEANTTYQVCGTNPFVTNPAVTFTVGDPCVSYGGKCQCYVPTTTTTSSTTTTTTLPLCRCYGLVYTPSSEGAPILGYSYVNCNGITVGGSIVPFSTVNLCARQNSVVAYGVTVYDNGACTTDCTSTTTTSTTIIPASTTTTSTTTTTTTIAPIECNCLVFVYPKSSTVEPAVGNISYLNCDGTLIETTLATGNSLQDCGSSPTADLTEITILQGGQCNEATCPPCTCYSLYNSTEGTKIVYYYNCQLEKFVTLSLNGFDTVQICAFPGSILSPVQVIVTSLNSSCSVSLDCQVVSGFFEVIAITPPCDPVWVISQITFDGISVIPDKPYTYGYGEFFVNNTGTADLVINLSGPLSAGSISIIDSNSNIQCLPLASTMTFTAVEIDNLTPISITIDYCNPCP